MLMAPLLRLLDSRCCREEDDAATENQSHHRS
jgi:hypothetical protein